MDKDLLFLKQIIETKVFHTKANVRIAYEGLGEQDWIMDFRNVFLHPSVLRVLSDHILKRYEGRDFQIGGLEVASIALVSGVVVRSTESGIVRSGFFVRKSRKKSGLLKAIEGEVIAGKEIILVDDLINSGGSLLRAIDLLVGEGHIVKEVFVVLRFRDESYYQEFIKRGVKVTALFCLDDFQESLHVVNVKEKQKAFLPERHEIAWYFKSEGAHFEIVVPKSQPLLYRNKLYVGSDSGHMWCIESTTGKSLWSYKILFGDKGKMILSSPCAYEGMIFFGAYDGNMYALDAENGKVLWIARDADWIGSSPCIAEDKMLVIVGTEFGFWKKRGGVSAYDIKTGKRVWQTYFDGLTHGSPTYTKRHGLVICGSNEGTVHALSIKTGKELWSYTAGGEVKEKCVLSPDEKHVAFGSFGKEFVVLNTKTGDMVAKLDTLEANYSTPVWRDKRSFVATSLDKKVYCYDIIDKKVLWTFATPSRIFASPIILNDEVIIGNNSARLYFLDIYDGSQKEIVRLVERVVNAIAHTPDGSMIFVPTIANELIAYKKKA